MAGDFRDAMKAGVREMQVRGRAVFLTGAEIAVEARDIVSVRISEGADDGLLPGSVLAASCSLVLDNSSGKWTGGAAGDLLVGSVFELEMEIKCAGEWIFEPLGVFVCRDTACDEGSTVITLSMGDYLDGLGDVDFEDGLSYPCTLGEVYEHVLSQIGYNWETEFPAGDVIIDGAPRWGKATVRDALSYVAQAAGCFARIGRGGEFRLVPVTGEGDEFQIGPEHYMSRVRCDGHFGPVSAVSIMTVNAKGDKDSESEGVFLGRGPSEGGAVIEISGNPLYITGGKHLRELAQATMDAVYGLEYFESRFSWRGDPGMAPGSKVAVMGLDGEISRGVLSRQTLEFSGGFHAECVCGVPENGAGKALASGGGIDAGRLIGVIPGENISAESITAGKIAAGAVTADKISAGAVSADKIAAGAITAGKIDAEAVTADKIAAGAVTAGKIDAGAVTADKIAAGAVTAEKIAAEAVETQHIKAGAIDASRIASGTITGDHIKAKSISANQLRAGIIAADSGLIGLSAIRTAHIADAAITAAKVSSLNADVIDSGTLRTRRLLLVGKGGVVYEINAASSGLTQTELTDEKYQNYINGTVIVAKSLTAEQIAAKTITGTEIAANSIVAANIDVADLFASEATIYQLNAADISGNKSLQMVVGKLEIGGRNLIRNSRSMVFEDYVFDAGTAAAVLDRGVLDKMILGG